MENKFNYFKKLYQDNKFDILLGDKESVYWLKLRSISRKELMIDFCLSVGINCVEIKGPKLFEHIYSIHPSEGTVDKFIEERYALERSARKENEVKLTSELYKMQVLDWGGLYQNNLEKTIVNNYVKKIRDFDLLNKKIENEIHSSVKGYVQSSWYNHWTSILIEDVFKDHKRVIPTVGLIKKVDFFIDNIPFDLKVTYFPDGFMAAKRKASGFQTEIQTLKKIAKEVGIVYDKKQKEKAMFNELMIRIRESSDLKAKSFIKEFDSLRWKIVNESIKDHSSLVKWLYEEQGERRFDAANRLFLILIDKANFEESWKMKRNIDLLKGSINGYLDRFDSTHTERLNVNFSWINDDYSAISDVLFVIKK